MSDEDTQEESVNSMPNVSYSETSSYLLCKRKHYYGYTRSLKPIKTSEALSMGSLIHEILEAYYRTILSGGDTVSEQQSMIPAAMEAARGAYDAAIEGGYKDEAGKRATVQEVVFDYYLDHMEPYVSKGWRVLAVEKEFTLAMEQEEGQPDDEVISTPFVIDLILRDPKGKIVVVDHKNIWDFITPEEAALNPQIPLYMACLRGLNYKVDRGEYNMLRTRRIDGPKMKKDELVEVVSAAVTAGGGFPESDFDKPVPKLTVAQLEEIAVEYGIVTQSGATDEQRHQTLPLKPSSARVMRTFLEQIDTAKEIQALKRLDQSAIDLKAHRVANKMVCKSCDFRDLCSTELEGGNTALLLKLDFTERTRREMSGPSPDYEEVDVDA